MADALGNGCDNIVTCGGIQSNHARATAVVAAQLGLKPHLLLRMTEPAAVSAVCIVSQATPPSPQLNLHTIFNIVVTVLIDPTYILGKYL